MYIIFKKETPPSDIIIEIDGGVLSNIETTINDLKILIIDHDDLEEELHEILDELEVKNSSYVKNIIHDKVVNHIRQIGPDYILEDVIKNVLLEEKILISDIKRNNEK